MCLVEIKNATFLDEAVVQFPDAVTTRGLKHLELLLKAARVGYRSCLVFAINRPETTRFRPASHVDPQYAARLAEAAGNGVEIILAVLRHDETGVGVVGGRYWTETDDGCA